MSKNEEKILLVLASGCQLQKSVDVAINETIKRKGKLAVLFVVDSKAAENITSALSDSGFIGDKPSQDLRNTLLNEYRQRAVNKVRDIAKEAYDEKVEINTYVIEGELEKTALKLIDEIGATLIVIPRCKKVPMSEMIIGAACTRLELKAPCEVLTVEEG